MSSYRMSSIVALACVVLFSSATSGADRFPFVISGYDATPSATDFSQLSHVPAGKHGFVRVADGHFATDVGRLRIWGANLSFGANFPTHDEADKVAAHLAKIGINGVRIHHHETQYSPNGLFREDGTWDPQQVDRLDYFLAQLHRHGIYADLNLHVGRQVGQRLGLPPLGTEHYLMYDKHALHFQPEIQQAFWQFCREYLEHVNPYRKLRRADDPGVAMLEICNENKFSEAGPNALLAAPEPYRATLIRKWNDWLGRRYTNTATIRNAWATGDDAPARTLADSQNWGTPARGGWTLSDDGGRAPIKLVAGEQVGQPLLRFEPQVRAAQAWHQQFASETFTVEAGKTYLLRFALRADKTRNVGLHVATTQDGNWIPLGLSLSLEAGPKWSTFESRFSPPRTIRDGAKVSFDIGGDETAVELKQLELLEGGNWVALPQDQSLEAQNIALPGTDWVPRAHADFREFMLDTERAFYRQTMHLLREEIGVRVPITTTQVNYQPMAISAEIADFTDMHAYWHHPTFPGRQWDADNWNVQNETLVAFPFANNWPRLNMLMRTPWRLLGKPFTFSEWNTGEPGFFAADAIPIAALTASLQDWDAVFFFNYHSTRGNWDTDRIQGYFDLNGQPCKIALVSALANLYRRVDLAPLTEVAAIAPGNEDAAGALALTHLVGTDPRLTTGQSHLTVHTDVLNKAESRLITSPDGAVVWDARELDRARVLIDTPRTKCVWGLVGGETLSLGDWTLAFGQIERNYAVFVATSRDDWPLEQSRSILITVLSNAENQNMGWNSDRTSVGRQWGNGPTLVNGVPVDVRLKTRAAHRVYALDPSGQRVAEVPVTSQAESTLQFRLGPQWKTLWYELEMPER